MPLPRPGRWPVLVVTKVGSSMIGAGSEVKVISAAKDRIPAPGEAAPAAPTETLASAKGDIKSIDTRVPPDDMHDVDFEAVRGKKPVALLFATPQLCESRVCGPVVDIALQLKAKYGDRMEFIHQEVFVDNKPDRGLRAPLRTFGLQTEPWLFVVGRDGRVTARLEGSFGFRAFERAINSAL